MVINVHDTLLFLVEDYKKITNITSLPLQSKYRDLINIMQDHYYQSEKNKRLDIFLDLHLPNLKDRKKKLLINSYYKLK